MNKVILSGRLVSNPVVYPTKNNNKIIVITLAVDDWRTKESFFHKCVAFGKNAEYIENNFNRGDLVLIDGRLTSSSYVNKEGKKITTTEVTIDNSEILNKIQRKQDLVSDENISNIDDEKTTNDDSNDSKIGDDATGWFDSDNS